MAVPGQSKSSRVVWVGRGVPDVGLDLDFFLRGHWYISVPVCHIELVSNYKTKLFAKLKSKGLPTYLSNVFVFLVYLLRPGPKNLPIRCILWSFIAEGGNSEGGQKAKM